MLFWLRHIPLIKVLKLQLGKINTYFFIIHPFTFEVQVDSKQNEIHIFDIHCWIKESAKRLLFIHVFCCFLQTFTTRSLYKLPNKWLIKSASSNKKNISTHNYFHNELLNVLFNQFEHKTCVDITNSKALD